jgi:UDP-GlcNAc:undecaprenyl-phosphate GlcNAc-1-phosphate transferase
MVYVLIVIVAAAVTWILTFVVRAAAHRYRFVVSPGGRMVHTQPTPTLGGLAMAGGFLCAFGFAWIVPSFRPIFSHSSEPLGVVIAALVITAVGALDDVFDVSAPAKLAGQILSSSMLWIFGATMFWFKLPFAGIVVLSASIIPLLTAIWVVAMENAVNLIDGLDGLAGGIVAIASLAFGIYALKLEDLGQLPTNSLGPLIAFAVFGICLGFLPHNFHPARIFMGDTGAMLLGLLMAASTSLVGGRTTGVADQTFFFFAPLFIPFLILGVPMLDLVFAVIRRTARRASVSSPDKDHLHHRLMQMGHGHLRSVLIMWAWTAVLAGIALVPTFFNQSRAELPFIVAALAITLYTLFRPGLRGRHARKRADGDVDPESDLMEETPSSFDGEQNASLEPAMRFAQHPEQSGASDMSHQKDEDAGDS